MKTYLVTTSGAEREDGERGYAWRVLAKNKEEAITAALGYHESDSPFPEDIRVDGCVIGESDGLGAVNDLTENHRRWKRVEYAMKAEGYLEGDDDFRTAVVDILADIMHVCASKRIRFDDALDSARNHFSCERHEGC